MAYIVMAYIVVACRFIMCLGMWVDTMWFTLLNKGMSTVILKRDDGKLRLSSQPDVLWSSDDPGDEVPP